MKAGLIHRRYTTPSLLPITHEPVVHVFCIYWFYFVRIFLSTVTKRLFTNTSPAHTSRGIYFLHRPFWRIFDGRVSNTVLSVTDTVFKNILQCTTDGFSIVRERVSCTDTFTRSCYYNFCVQVFYDQIRSRPTRLYANIELWSRRLLWT